MKLRRQLTIIIALVVIMPIAALLFYAQMDMGNGLPGEPILRYAKVKRFVMKAVRFDEENLLRTLPGIEAPPGLSIVILDNNGTSVYANDEELFRRSGMTVEELSAHTAEEKGRLVLTESIMIKGRIVGTYIAVIDTPPTMRDQPMFLSTMAVWYLFILAASGIGISIVISRLGSAIFALERAAENIARGDLDTAVPILGPHEIESLALAMEQMRLSLKEEEGRRIRFIAAVSHDLKTPLTSITGYIEALQDGLVAHRSDRDHYLSIMADKAQALERRVADLLDFAKASTAEWQARLDPVPLADYLDRMAAAFSTDASLIGLSFVREITVSKELRVLLDPSLVYRAVENIVANCFRYCPPGSMITFRALQSSTQVDVTIRDNGPGIPAADMPHIFEPYFRGSHSRREEGSGLGLFISKSIVKNHGWDMIAESAEGAGSSFTIKIPLGKTS